MWSEIIVAVITSGVIIALVEIIRDWRNKRKDGKANADMSDYTAQRQGLDLVSEFYSRVKALLDDGVAQDIKELKDDVKEIRRDQAEIKSEQDRERRFLNGEYQKWLENNK
jgi:hypothetical protein